MSEAIQEKSPKTAKKAEEIQELETPVPQKKAEEIYSEAMMRLMDRMEQMEKKEEPVKVVENTPELPSNFRAIPSKPRKIVYQIKGYVADDAMKDGAYIPGKFFGLTKHNLISYLTNTNIDWENSSLDRWQTGLEADEVELSDKLTDEEKTVLINDIKAARAWLEYKTGQSFDNRNRNVWAKVKLEVNDTGKIYDTTKDEDLILYYNLLAGGHPDIATSYDKCKAQGKNLYLAVYEEEAKRKTAGDKPRRRAYSKLDEIEDNWSLDDCLYLLYVLPTKKSHGFTLNTPKSSIIQELSDFIDGVGQDDKKKKPQEFLDAVSLFSSDPQYIKTKGLFKAAVYYGFIITTKEKTYTNKQTGFIYGSSEQQAMSKLIDIKNVEELGYIKAKILEKWNK